MFSEFTQNNITENLNIFIANLLAKNTTLNIGNNLNIESKQTEEDYSSSGFGFNFGVSVGASGKGGNISGGFNMSNSDMHRLWVDDVTTIKATNSMAVNVLTHFLELNRNLKDLLVFR